MGSRVHCTEIIAPGMAGTDSLLPHWVSPAPPGHHLLILPPSTCATKPCQTRLSKWPRVIHGPQDRDGCGEGGGTRAQCSVCPWLLLRGPRTQSCPWVFGWAVNSAKAWWSHSGGSSFSHPQHSERRSPSLLPAARHNSISFAEANLFTAAFIHKLMKDQNIKMFVFD